MSRTLFTNVSILDGTGAAAFDGAVLVEDNRIARVARDGASIAAPDAAIVDGGGATLMPGLTDAHAHLSFLNAPGLAELTSLPAERQVLMTAKNAELLLDHGFTSMFGGAAARPRIDIAVRDAINAGEIPGPRLLASSRPLTVTGGFGDLGTGEEEGYSTVLDGAEAFRAAARKAARDGVDVIKIVPSAPGSGPDLVSEDTVMSDAEMAAAVEVAHQRGRRVAAHARSAGAVKMCVRHGVDMIFHATLADGEARDALESVKDRVFVAPAAGLQYARLHEGENYGIATPPALRRKLEAEFEIVSECMADLHKRGVRVLPGGDFGFAWNPHGRNARDLAMFVECFGFTPLEAIRAATQWGGALMGHGGGSVAEGALADLLLVDGDPVADIAILQDRARFLAIMKDGAFHRSPPARMIGQREAAE